MSTTSCSRRIGEPEDLIDSGAALLHSPAWTQMMADALGRPIIACQEKEGHQPRRALLAMERTGAIAHIREFCRRNWAAFTSLRKAGARLRRNSCRRQRRLYSKLFEEN